jgi:hypothetical protein
MYTKLIFISRTIRLCWKEFGSHGASKCHCTYRDGVRYKIRAWRRWKRVNGRVEGRIYDGAGTYGGDIYEEEELRSYARGEQLDKVAVSLPTCYNFSI